MTLSSHSHPHHKRAKRKKKRKMITRVMSTTLRICSKKAIVIAETISVMNDMGSTKRKSRKKWLTRE
jgi:hypothetical protein